MNIFQFAQQMEQDGEKYYRDLAEKCTDRGLKTILTGMAEDEVKHYKIFKDLEKDADPELAGTVILSSAKNVFEQMKAAGGQYDMTCEQVAAYEKARDVELHSENFYREKAEEVDKPYVKELLHRIADEEKKHAHLLENIIEFISKPDAYLENAEFGKLDEF